MALLRQLVRLQRAQGVMIRTVLVRTQQTAATAAPQLPAPEVYTVMPPQPKEKKPGQLEKWQLEQFFDKGFVVVPKFFTKDEMQQAIEGVEECLDIIAEKLFKGGKIKDKCVKAGFYERLILIEQQFKGAAVLLHKTGYLPAGFRNLWSNDRLLNAVEQLIGPNIAGHPVWNLRTKTPKNEQTTVPWHQDNSYLDLSALYTLIPTAWIPLIDANIKNGCLQMISGGQKPGVTAKHVCCAGGTWYTEVEEDEMENSLGVNLKRDVVTCEIPFGGLVLFNNCIPHRSLENNSNKTRWSLDLRWQDPSKPTGFFDLKEPVIMRKADDPHYNIDWEDFAAKDRTSLQESDTGYTPEDEFDTTIHGPWMKRWDIVHHNRHTESMSISPNSHMHKA